MVHRRLLPLWIFAALVGCFDDSTNGGNGDTSSGSSGADAADDADDTGPDPETGSDSSATGTAEGTTMGTGADTGSDGSGGGSTDTTSASTDTGSDTTDTTDGGTTDTGSTSTADTTGTTSTTGATGTTGTTSGTTGAVCVTQRFGENTNDDVTGVTVDTYLGQGLPNMEHGNDAGLHVDGTTLLRQNTLVRFNLTSISASATVTGASLLISTNSSNGSSSSPGNQFNVYVVNEAWFEGQANWNVRMTGVQWSSPGCVGSPCHVGGAEGFFEPSAQATTYEIPIDTAVVEGWVADAATNNGLIIRTAAGDGATFHASESGGMNLRPAFEVTHCE